MEDNDYDYYDEYEDDYDWYSSAYEETYEKDGKECKVTYWYAPCSDVISDVKTGCDIDYVYDTCDVHSCVVW